MFLYSIIEWLAIVLSLLARYNTGGSPWGRDLSDYNLIFNNFSRGDLISVVPHINSTGIIIITLRLEGRRKFVLDLSLLNNWPLIMNVNLFVNLFQRWTLRLVLEDTLQHWCHGLLLYYWFGVLCFCCFPSGISNYSAAVSVCIQYT